MKTAVYTVLFGDYDNFREPEYVDPDYDYYLFTDQNIESENYEVIFIVHHLDRSKRDLILQARTWKIFNGYDYLCINNYDSIIYHDCNIIPTASLKDLVDNQVTDFMTIKHPGRDCIYQEYEVCCDVARDDVHIMNEQVQRYADDNYPINNGLIASGVIFRRNTEDVKTLCAGWLQEVEGGSIRDQLSFNYVATKLNFKFDLLPWGIIGTYFNYYKHKK